MTFNKVIAAPTQPLVLECDQAKVFCVWRPGDKEVTVYVGPGIGSDQNQFFDTLDLEEPTMTAARQAMIEVISELRVEALEALKDMKQAQ